MDKKKIQEDIDYYEGMKATTKKGSPERKKYDKILSDLRQKLKDAEDEEGSMRPNSNIGVKGREEQDRIDDGKKEMGQFGPDSEEQNSKDSTQDIGTDKEGYYSYSSSQPSETKSKEEQEGSPSDTNTTNGGQKAGQGNNPPHKSKGPTPPKSLWERLRKSPVFIVGLIAITFLSVVYSLTNNSGTRGNINAGNEDSLKKVLRDSLNKIYRDSARQVKRLQDSAKKAQQAQQRIQQHKDSIKNVRDLDSVRQAERRNNQQDRDSLSRVINNSLPRPSASISAIRGRLRELEEAFTALLGTNEAIKDVAQKKIMSLLLKHKPGEFKTNLSILDENIPLASKLGDLRGFRGYRMERFSYDLVEVVGEPKYQNGQWVVEVFVYTGCNRNRIGSPTPVPVKFYPIRGQNISKKYYLSNLRITLVK